MTPFDPLKLTEFCACAVYLHKDWQRYQALVEQLAKKKQEKKP